MLKESFLEFTPSQFCLPFFLELYEGAQTYTFPQSLYELKAQLGQQLAHAQTFDRGVVPGHYFTSAARPAIALERADEFR